MKRRWRILLGAGGLLLLFAALPIIRVEGFCRPDGKMGGANFISELARNQHRDEARSWLTYPEWHIVHSADSYGRHLADGRRPSSYAFMEDVGGFWRSTCAVNRIGAGGGDAKVMIYTIGLSFSAEMAVKAAWENTIGRFFEWASGYRSGADRFQAMVQQRYGAFMHVTPWYEYPFGKALSLLWKTNEDREVARQWERKFSGSIEYGIKAAYASLIGWASGATLGRDQLTLQFTTPASPARLALIDPRLEPVGRSKSGLTIVEAPRYAEFTELVRKLAKADIPISEIAGNDDIFLTVLARSGTELPGDTLFAMPLADRHRWERVGMLVKVDQLNATLPGIEAAGATVEHVHDY